MRTRSQPDSPGGFVSLEQPKRATRRTTRSASRAASQEPSSQQSTESSVTQPTTRSKSQRTTRKTTTKKTTSTAEVTKPQGRKGSKRGTRNTTRKAARAVLNEAQKPIDENHSNTARTDNEDNVEVGTEEPAPGSSTSGAVLLEPKNSEREYHKSPLPLQIPLLPSPPPRSPDPQESQELQDLEGNLDEQIDNILKLQQEVSDWYTFQQAASAAVPLEPRLDDAFGDFEDFYLTLPDIGETPVPSYFELDPEERQGVENTISSLDSPLVTLGSKDLANPHTSELPAEYSEGLARVLEEAAENITAMASTKSQTTVSSFEKVDAAEPTAVKPKGVKQSNDKVAVYNESANRKETVFPLISSVNSEEQTTVEDKSVNELTEIFAKLSLSKVVMPHEAAVSSRESITVPTKLPELNSASAPTGPESSNNRQPASVSSAPVACQQLASIYDDAPPSIPLMELLTSATRVQQVQQLTLFGEIPDSPSSIYEDGKAPPSVDTVKRQESVEEPLAPVVLEDVPGSIASLPLRSSRVGSGERRVSRAQRHRKPRHWPVTLLSPIPEERDLDTQTSSGAELEGATLSQAPPTFPATPIGPSLPPSFTVQTISTSSSPSASNIGQNICSKPLELLSSPNKSNKTSPKSESSSKCTLKTPKTPKNPETPKALASRETQNTPQIHKFSKMAKLKEKLTKKKVNRKRSRTENSPDDNTEPATPYANKRRNVGPAGSTPFARRHTDLTRRLSNAAPYSERLRRRRAESQGRIHSTIFRLPQFVAQTEADRRASETSESTDFSTEPLQTNLDISSEQAETDDQAVAEEPAITQEPTVAQEPSTPEPANRGWNISGLLNSVPRSFSRFLPKFGRSPARSEVPASQQPASERIRRIQPSEVSSATVTERESQSRRRLSEQPPTKRARNLSYSLFPTPIDRSLYLGDVPTETTARTTSTSVSTSAPAPAPALAAQPAQEDMPQRVQSQTESQTLVTSTERGRDSTPKASNTPSESHKKKRKRSSSPDVIPNPAGASYGLDLDYFDYSSDNEDDEAEPSVPQTEPRKTDTFGNTSLRSAVQSERPASKKVRFDQSPEDTPSKRRRPHATEPYHGDHFRGLGDSQALSAPTTPTPQRIVDPRQRPGFIPNRTGTFELNYDDFSDDSDSDDTSPTGAPTTSATTATPTRASTTSVPPPNGVTQTPTSTQSGALRSAQPPASGSAAVPASNPSLDKLRSKAEKYKPKTPSGLRTASRYSSPLTAPTPDMTPDVTPTPPAEKMTEKVAEKFGDDQFAKDAQWLYEKCPSGDLRKLDWPETRPFGENLNVSANALRILNEIWDPAEIEDAYDVFQREYAEFKKTLA